MTQQLLIVGHGSRVPQAVTEFNTFAAAVAAKIDIPASTCFLELADPDLATGLTDAARAVGAGGDVLVLPLFLGGAAHQKNDVAAAIHWAREQFPDVEFRYGTPLSPHANLVTLTARRVEDALIVRTDARPPEETAVLVVGRGSSDPASNAEIARTAHLLWEKRPYRTVEYAFQAVAHPKVADGLQRCLALGARQIVVMPYLLFSGKVDEAIRAIANRFSHEYNIPVLITEYLNAHPLVVDVAVQRVQEMLENTASMTCDLCKYRFPMAGYEHQVGVAQHTHHLHGGSTHRHNHDHHHHHG